MKRPPEELAEKLLAVSDQLSGTDLDVSIDDIAKMADVPRATLYYYFSGKEDLISFFLSDKLHRASVAIGKAVAGEGTVVERLPLAPQGTEAVDRMLKLAARDGLIGPLVRVGDDEGRIA